MLQNVNTLDTSVNKQPTHLLVWSISAGPEHQDPSCLQKETWRWCHTEFYREDLSGRDQRDGMEQIKKKKTGVFSHQHRYSPALKRNLTFEWKVTSLFQVVFTVRHESQFLRAPHCVFANAFSRQTPSGELITRKWKWPANAHQSGIIRICDSPSAPPCLRTVPRRTAKINFCRFQRQQTK